MASQFRIHPSVGFARVGNSPQYLLEPQTMAGVPQGAGVDQTGGLPIVPGTESQTVVASQLRDDQDRLKRQASRFKLFAYPVQENETYPMGEQGVEVHVGDTVDGKKVREILWSVHLANKKANWYKVPTEKGVMAYLDGATPEIRNPACKGDKNDGSHSGINDPYRLNRLVIDPGPRAISSTADTAVAFDRQTPASIVKDAGIQQLDLYNKRFPGDNGEDIYYPQDTLDSLGELQTDEHGRLIVTGGYGRTAALLIDGKPAPLEDDTNNDGWFDDCADGPVTATVVFDDGTTLSAAQGAWVVATDPAFAPQITNSVTLWDDLFDVWVRHLDLRPDIFKRAPADPDDDGFQDGFKPSFDTHISPVLRSADLHRWATNLNELGITNHKITAAITPSTNPHESVLGGMSAIRDPAHKNPAIGQSLMPLSMGDAGHDFLSLRRTQYFFLRQWSVGKAIETPDSTLNEGETLDKTVLFNCQGGRLSPGIELSICGRDPAIWVTDWRTSGGGPFRVKHKPLNYTAGSTSGDPLLTGGYVPDFKNNPETNQTPVSAIQNGAGLEPGDLSKFMALPWHTDYNSCATHPADNGILYWSWPAQRPVAVYLASEVTSPDVLPEQRWSVRGKGAEESTVPREQGRFAPMAPIVNRWQDIGIVVQATAIDDNRNYDPHSYLEVASLMGDTSQPVAPWPTKSDPD